MGITPSTATQVASPISPVSVINPNYSYPIQDEEEEGEWLTEDEQEETPVKGEWLTEDEQEEIVLDSSSADIKKEGF
ncbi:11664_t:CDS:2 [Rhizophagus irregularis]|nr:11664_t:CDS:2 [Rhizophagus irregularis]